MPIRMQTCISRPLGNIFIAANCIVYTRIGTKKSIEILAGIHLVNNTVSKEVSPCVSYLLCRVFIFHATSKFLHHVLTAHSQTILKALENPWILKRNTTIMLLMVHHNSHIDWTGRLVLGDVRLSFTRFYNFFINLLS